MAHVYDCVRSPLMLNYSLILLFFVHHISSPVSVKQHGCAVQNEPGNDLLKRALASWKKT